MIGCDCAVILVLWLAVALGLIGLAGMAWLLAYYWPRIKR